MTSWSSAEIPEPVSRTQMRTSFPTTARPDRDAVVGDRVLHRVVREVHHGLGQALPVAEDHPAADPVEAPAARGERGRLREQLVREELEVDPLAAEEVRMLGLGEQLEVVDDPADPVELVEDERGRRPPLLRVVPEELQVASTYRQRVAELVARVLDELPLALEDGLESVEHRVEAPRHLGGLAGRRAPRFAA